MLPLHNWISFEVTDVDFGMTASLNNEHPSQMSPEYPLFDVVGIFLGVDITMMSAVAATPKLDATLPSTRSDYS